MLDHGHGFAVDTALQARGRGPKHQLRRAEVLGAWLSWASSPAGTRCVLWLPMEAGVVPVSQPSLCRVFSKPSPSAMKVPPTMRLNSRARATTWRLTREISAT